MSRNYRPQGKYQVTSHIAVILMVLILFVSVGYFFYLARPDEEAQRLQLAAELEDARILWRVRKPAAYQYVVDRVCECPAEDAAPYTVYVSGNNRRAEFAIPVELTSGEQVMTPPRPVWINDLFELAERAIRSNVEVTVRYNSGFGYPRQLEIGDDGYEIRDFEVVDSARDIN